MDLSLGRRQSIPFFLFILFIVLQLCWVISTAINFPILNKLLKGRPDGKFYQIVKDAASVIIVIFIIYVIIQKPIHIYIYLFI